MVRFCTAFFNVGKICQRMDPTDPEGRSCNAGYGRKVSEKMPSTEHQRSVSMSIRTGPWINVRRWLGLMINHVLFPIMWVARYVCVVHLGEERAPGYTIGRRQASGCRVTLWASHCQRPTESQSCSGGTRGGPSEHPADDHNPVADRYPVPPNGKRTAFTQRSSNQWPLKTS